MGPIVLLGGVLVLLYAVASAFGGTSVASAKRGVEHSRRYALLSTALGVALVVVGVVMIAA